MNNTLISQALRITRALLAARSWRLDHSVLTRFPPIRLSFICMQRDTSIMAQAGAFCNISPATASAQAPVEIPADFLCPISLELMTGPVICLQSRMVYDHSSMHAWLRQGGSSDPLTGIPFQSPVVLRPYLPLQQRIASWCRENEIEYKAQKWTAPPDGDETASIAAPLVSGCEKLLATVQALGKALVSRRPHPFDTYKFIH